MEGSVSERVKDVLERISRAAARSGRPPESVKLIAVSKMQPVELVKEALDAGIRHFGENYVQEAEGKIRAFPEAEWHFIGKLQGNKVKKAVSLFGCIQTIDSSRLLSDVSRRCVESGKIMPILIEVNLGGEESKAGLPPDDLPALLACAVQLPGIKVRGLMAIPPVSDDPEGSRPRFAHLRDLLERNASFAGPASEMTELSMGMSNDFEAAIEEGATMVRVGTAIFGSRVRRQL